MRKLILIVHTSLDGFVAAENGSFEKFTQSPENLDFVCSLTDNADAALAGRNTFEMLQSHWPTAYERPGASPSEIKYSEWYNAAQKIVLSDSLNAKDLKNTNVLSGNMAEQLLEIKKRQGKDILMFGSPAAFQTLDRLDLIDEYWVIQYPAIFGSGLSFFTLSGQPKQLKLIETKTFSLGEIAIHYEVVHQ